MNSEQHLPFHRHSATAKAAMNQLRTLDTDNPLNQGWTFHTERNGVKIYSKLLPGETIPHFRGDGWIDGDWPLEDIAAVVKSLGARTIWDERNDFGKTCAMFNSFETLCHVGMRGSFPVGDRDFSVVSNLDIDKKSETVYFASKSVEDPLIPMDKRVRGNLLLGGWIIHRCNSRPAPTTMNFIEVKRSPATNRKTSSVHTSTSFYNVRGSRGQIKIEPLVAAFAPPPRIEGPCARLTFVVQIDMRGAVPHTIINSLALQQPLVVATLSQYVSKFGFPPYFDCENIKRGITVLTEEFEHKIGSYNLIYKADGDHKDNVTRVRFCKTMFKEGYEVEVKRAGSWRVVEDDEKKTGGRGITVEIDNGGREGVPIQVKVTRKKRCLSRRPSPPPPVSQVLPSTTASEALLFEWPMPPARDVNSGVVLARQ